MKREIYESDLVRLLKLLTVDTSQIDLMAELSVQFIRVQVAEKRDFEEETSQAITKCLRRIEATRHLDEDGDMSREEYLRRKEQNECEFAHWEARTTETEKIAYELTLCLEAIYKINQRWEISEDEDKQGTVCNLFSHIVDDLDIQRIVDFRLKPWADRFVTLRASLYGDSEGNENPLNSVQGVGTQVAPTGYLPLPRYFTLPFSVQRAQRRFVPQPETPVKILMRAKAQEMREQGMSYPQIAKELGVSVGSAWNLMNYILKRNNKRCGEVRG